MSDTLDVAPETLPTPIIAPGVEPRLVVQRPGGGPMGLADEQALGHLSQVLAAEDTTDVVAALQEAGLQGRGGAAFPAHVKWRSLCRAHGDKVVVANGHEGEPSSAKDRWLLLNRPFLVLDGLLLAAVTTGANRAIVYVSRSDTEQAARAAIAEVEAAGLVPPGIGLEVFRTEHRYVAGEESAVVRAINGGPALPTAKPPHPYEKGVADLPTLVQNVETLSHAAWIHRHGAAAFRSQGTRNSPGTALFSIITHDHRFVLIEAALGTKLVDLLAMTGVPAGDVTRLLLGGWFGGVHGVEVLGLEACFTALRVAGSGLGCAALTVLGADVDPRRVVSELGAWYARETAGQCGVCRNGTKSIAKALRTNAEGVATDEDFENLARWGVTLPGRGACHFLDGAATLARTTVAVVGSKPYVRAVDNPAATDQPVPVHSAD